MNDDDLIDAEELEESELLILAELAAAKFHENAARGTQDAAPGQSGDEPEAP